MIHGLDRETRDSIERSLDLNYPSPEVYIRALCNAAMALPDDTTGARVRLLVAGLDDLLSQARWHLACVLYLIECHGDAMAASGNDDVRMDSIPASVWLAGRAYGRNMDRVVFESLLDPRPGGPAAAWILHMLIDSAIYRMLAALDRLAGILWVAAGLPQTEGGRPVRVYFRSGKMKRIQEKLPSRQSAQLVEISSGPLIEYVTDYRDGLSHDFKVFSSQNGWRPAERKHSVSERQQRLELARLDPEGFVAFTRATYGQLVDALGAAVIVLADVWPGEGVGDSLDVQQADRADNTPRAR